MLTFMASLALDMNERVFSVSAITWSNVNVYFKAQIDREGPARAGAAGMWQLVGLADDDGVDVVDAFAAGKFYADDEQLRADIARVFDIETAAVDLDIG
jgi:hypothetical protein